MFGQKTQRAFGVHLRQILRGGDEDSSGERELVSHDLKLITGSGRRVDQQDIGGPSHLEDEFAE